MTAFGTPAWLHIVGYLTGVSLYAMLLAMVIRTRGLRDRLTFTTGILGLTSNVGALAAQLFETFGRTLARDGMAAVSYASLGFLAAVVIHSAGRRHADDEAPRTVTTTDIVALAGYVLAGIAAGMQLFAATVRRPLPSPAGLMLMTIGLAVLSVPLLLATRRQPNGRRALWMTALALAAVSALHLGRFHGSAESWSIGLLGHHASIPLAFAILYQDFRFAFADLYLKRALTLLVLVSAVFFAWSLVEPHFVQTAPDPLMIGILLTLWIGTALAFPWLHRRVASFVDRIVLKRADYGKLVDNFSTTLQDCESEEGVLRHACSTITRGLNAESITWAPTSSVGAGVQGITVATTEEPRPLLTIQRLATGRRLLSDDTMMLERIALLAGRRIDALRLRDERYERMLRERDISRLATEAELRALRAQINPHFLFNALTTLGYLIQSAPGRALDTLLHLTTLLRSTLRSEGEFTTLGHERELIECYLQIERERFEERLEVCIDVAEDLAELSIPSLIVQPLVENAVKHGIARSRSGGRVTVSASVLETSGAPQLRIVVRNSGAPLNGRAPAAGDGVGLQNVERRLQNHYGAAAELRLVSGEGNETIAELRLPVFTRLEEHTRHSPRRIQG